jgi:predicted dehydrogenase
MKQSRRDFLLKTTLASGALLASPYTHAASIFNGSPANKVVVAIMGTNGRGAFLAKNFGALPDVDVAYICDVDANVLERTRAEVEKISGRKPKGFTDIRKLLEQKDLDALVVAAPDHWHAPAAIMACQAGKHVYVEKPCSHNPAEGELLVAAAEKYGRLVQMGSQRRSFSNVNKAISQLHNGVIGKVYYARGWYTNWRKSIGFGKEIAPPSTLDFDLWQGPAPRKNYRDNVIHYNWHWFWHWGTGEALNNGTHEIDVMRWGMGVDYPVRVTSAGGRFAFKDDWETPDTQTITFNFSNNTAFTWEGRSCNGYDGEGTGRGVIFYGEKGTLVYPGANSYKILDPQNKVITDVKDDTPFDATNKVSPLEKLDVTHLKNFVESIREKEKLTAPILEGHKSTLLPQLGNIAYRVGRPLTCDAANGRIVNDREAQALWGREYEKGWEVKA